VPAGLSVRTFGAAIFASAWVTATALAAPQTGNLKDTQLNPDRVGTARRAIVIGCVSRAGTGQATRFVITDSRPPTPVQYRLDGNADLLRFHVGHMVEIAGPVVAVRGREAAAMGTLKVEALTYLSTSCTKL
jgi:hypothetical protein